MRKNLALLSLFILIVSSSYAQIIESVDTVCVGSPLQLRTTVTNGNSYYWGFCSAYLPVAPQGSSIAAGTGLDRPRSITMVEDTATNDIYIFVVNDGLLSREIIRYDFGSSLSNAPVANNLGDFGGLINSPPNGFSFAKDEEGWHAFLASGSGAFGSQLIRFDFPNGLRALPTATDLGNLSTLFRPQDIYIFKEAGNWHGLTMNALGGGSIIRLDFGARLSNLPTPNTIQAGVGFPTGFAPVMEKGNWHLFVVETITRSLIRYDFGSSLVNPISANTNLGNFNNALHSPRDISIIRDCDNWYGFVTNENNDSLVQLTFPDSVSHNTPIAKRLGNVAGFDGAIFLTQFKRSRDNVFAFTANNRSNSISRIEFNSCDAPDIRSAVFRTPPPVTYSRPGLFNVYLVIDEGMPTMQVDCKQIRVIPKPATFIQNDTLICKGDTIQITANAQGLQDILWTNPYNMLPPSGDTETVVIYPRENYEYDIRLSFASGGCIIDTSVTITVSQVDADAGEDRFVADGSYTILGGPTLSYGDEYSYRWSPSIYLDNARLANPRVDPKQSQFYILEVTNDTTGCVATDSVYVFNECTDIHLPNSFNPVSNVPENRTFGIRNNRLVALNYFRVFNRWGNLIFETNRPGIQWDGNFKNIPAPSGTYVWIVDGECDNGKRIQKQGSVFLVR